MQYTYGNYSDDRRDEDQRFGREGGRDFSGGRSNMMNERSRFGGRDQDDMNRGQWRGEREGSYEMQRGDHRGADAGSFGGDRYGGSGGFNRDRDQGMSRQGMNRYEHDRSFFYSDRGHGRGWSSQDRNRSGDDDRSFWDKAADEVKSWAGDDDAERRRRMDEQREDSHHGKGPKGYARSDDRIREDVCDRLTDDWRVDASDVEIKVENGEVTLSGHVDSRQAKRRAEDCADDVSGVKHVQNNLRVKDERTAMSGSLQDNKTAATPRRTDA